MISRTGYKFVMKEHFTSIVLLILLISTVVGCQQAPESPQPPKMTAAQVIEHINNVLENEYFYQGSVLRYEIRYNALSAEVWEIIPEMKGIWHITVKVVTEYQRLYEGQWVPFPGYQPKIDTYKYRFYEGTAQLELLQN